MPLALGLSEGLGRTWPMTIKLALHTAFFDLTKSNAIPTRINHSEVSHASRTSTEFHGYGSAPSATVLVVFGDASHVEVENRRPRWCP